MKRFNNHLIAMIQCNLGLNRRWRKLRPLPRFRSGGLLVDISDRNALYDAMDDLELYRRSR